MYFVADSEEESEKKPEKFKLICINRGGGTTDRKV